MDRITDGTSLAAVYMSNPTSRIPDNISLAEVCRSVQFPECHSCEFIKRRINLTDGSVNQVKKFRQINYPYSAR